MVTKEISYNKSKLDVLLKDLRKSGAIILEYEFKNNLIYILIRVNNMEAFINRYKKTDTFSLSSLTI